MNDPIRRHRRKPRHCTLARSAARPRPTDRVRWTMSPRPWMPRALCCPTRFSIRSARLSVLTRSSLIAKASACRAESGRVDTESDHRGPGTSLLKEAHMRTRQKEHTS